MDDVRAEAAAHERSGGTHFPCLDSYRGIGMTMVLMNHAAYATGYTFTGALGPYIARFDLSVPMFFVMSGFLLFRPFARAVGADRPTGSLRTFYRRRAMRILPSYWLALAGILVVFRLAVPAIAARFGHARPLHEVLPVDGVAGWIGNVVLAPAVGVPVQVCDGSTCRVAYGITQAWSIGVEATYYLLLPLFAMLLARLVRGASPARRTTVLLAGCGALYVAGTAFRIVVVTADPSWARESLLWLPMFLDLFGIGMAMAVVSTLATGAPGVGGALRRLLTFLGGHPAACWLGALALFLVMTRFNPPAEPFGLNDEYLPRQFVYGIASALWLAPAMFGDQSVGRLRKVLASRALVYLGAVSLSFYLWHLVIIDQVKRFTVADYAAREAMAANPPPGNELAPLAVFTGNYWLVAGLAFVLSLGTAALLHRFVERPFIDLKDRPLRALLPGRANTETAAARQ